MSAMLGVSGRAVPVVDRPQWGEGGSELPALISAVVHIDAEVQMRDITSGLADLQRTLADGRVIIGHNLWLLAGSP